MTDDPIFRYVKLTEGERMSSAWVKVSKYVEERIEEYRKKLEAPQSEADTAMLRGRIASLRNLLDLGRERTPPATFFREAQTREGLWHDN